MTHISVRQNDRLMAASMNRLSTGLRINSAREDAAGMAIANKLSFQLVGVQRASDNSQHGVSLIQTAEGALNEVHAMLQRMRELAVQAANDTNVEADRMAIQREINDLTDEITALSARSEFNTIKLLNGEAARVATSWVTNLINDDPLLSRVLATPLFVSENTPAGTLRYTITAASQHARIAGEAINGTDWTVAANIDGNIRINGINIEVRATDSMNDIWQKIVGTSDYAGVIPARDFDGTGTVISVTSIRTGSHERVELGGNADIWNLFGIYLPPDSYAFTYSSAVAGDPIELGFNRIPTINPAFNPDLPRGGANQPYLDIFYNIATNAFYEDAAFTTPITDTIPDSSTPIGFSGVITINGWPLEVEDWMTERDVFNMIFDAGNVNRNVHLNYGVASFEVRDTGAGWSIYPGRYNESGVWIPGGTLELTADSQVLNVNGDPVPNVDLWGTIFPGLSVTLVHEDAPGGTPSPSANRDSITSHGTDVQISNVRLYDRNGVLNADFNRALAVTTSGNHVSVTSAQGHTIRLNLHTPTSYRNQTFAQTTGALAGTVPAALLAGEAAWPPGGVTVNGIEVDIEAAMAAGAGGAAGIINGQLAAGGSPLTVAFDATYNTWAISHPTDPDYPILLGGTTAIWQAIGTPLNIMSAPTTLELDMELRIEEFGGLRIQIGPNYNMNMDIQIPRINAETLGLVEYRAGTMVRLLEYTTQEGAQRAIQLTDDAIQQISRVRARLGAYQNRLEHTIANLDNAAVNTEHARSRVQDTDMAREMTLLSKRQVMYQAGLAILGQANQRPQMILQLLQ